MKKMEYKGYQGTIDYSTEDQCYYGRIADIRDLINYESENDTDLEHAFRSAVDDYLALCQKRGEKPDTPDRNNPADPEYKKVLFVCQKTTVPENNTLQKNQTHVACNN
ncbi:MAG: hypothetical protein AAF669_03305 [Pseudomonadota bacterium]